MEDLKFYEEMDSITTCRDTEVADDRDISFEEV
jgi:hypothetical protein